MIHTKKTSVAIHIQMAPPVAFAQVRALAAAVPVRRRSRHPHPDRRTQRAGVGRRERQRRNADRPPLPSGRKVTPRPLLLTRHAGRGPLAEHAAQILALSKKDWNTDALYGSLPATVSYAQVLAKILKHENLPPVPYDYRLFM
jgi:hypothetical protein